MIGPELLAIERKRARGKWDRCEILHIRAFLLWMKPCNATFFRFVSLIFVLAAAQHVQRAIGTGGVASLRSDVNLTQNVCVVGERPDSFSIPLAHVKMRAIEA